MLRLVHKGSTGIGSVILRSYYQDDLADEDELDRIPPDHDTEIWWLCSTDKKTMWAICRMGQYIYVAEAPTNYPCADNEEFWLRRTKDMLQLMHKCFEAWGVNDHPIASKFDSLTNVIIARAPKCGELYKLEYTFSGK